MRVIRAGYEVLGQAPAMVGLIATLHFSGEELDGLTPARHILNNLLTTDVEPEDAVQDAVARIAVRLRDTYFVTLALSNYEERSLERPILPGMGPIRIRPWEGRVADVGLELVIDINNNLEAQTQREDPVVTDEGIGAVTSLLREVALTTGAQFAETGRVSVKALTASSAP